MARPVAKRYAWAPLEARLRARIGVRNFGSQGVIRAGVPAFAAEVGKHKKQIARWKADGLSLEHAEQAAEAIGEHPFVIWPDMRDDLIASTTRACAAPDCPETFLVHPRWPRKKWCSTTCGKRTRERAKYRKNPKPARARARRYDEKHRDEKRGYSRDYYRLNRERLLAAQRDRDRRRAAARKVAA